MSKIIDRGWSSRAPKLRHVAPFDGIRGVGVIAVMASHSLPYGTLSFAVWVDVFFVISGFLITTLLLQEHRNTGNVDIKKFYARRLLRLLPSLYVMLAGDLVVGLLIKWQGEMGARTLKGLVKEVVVAVLYCYNIFFPVHDGPWIDHVWTLSIEEQFYLVIGVVALLGVVQGGVKVIIGTLIALVGAIQVSRFFLAPGPLGTGAAAVWVQRPDSLMIGMLGAFASAHLPDPIPERAQRVLKAAGTLGAVVLIFAMWASTGWMKELGWDHEFVPKNFRELLQTGGKPTGFYWIQWGHTAAAWSMLFITFAAFRVPDWKLNRFLSWKPWVWVGGTMSYTLYLWHVPVQELVKAFFPDLPQAALLLLGVTLPFLAAYPAYRVVETRALKIKDRFAVERSKDLPQTPTEVTS